jgi:hypothetical protein
MKKSTQPKKRKQASGLSFVHPNAAGIDIGDNFHVVAVPEGRDKEHVKTFGSMSCDLISIASWLKPSKEIKAIDAIMDFVKHHPVQVILALPGKYSFLYRLTHQLIAEACCRNTEKPVLIVKQLWLIK